MEHALVEATNNFPYAVFAHERVELPVIQGLRRVWICGELSTRKCDRECVELVWSSTVRNEPFAPRILRRTHRPVSSRRLNASSRASSPQFSSDRAFVQVGARNISNTNEHEAAHSSLIFVVTKILLGIKDIFGKCSEWRAKILLESNLPRHFRAFRTSKD